MPGPKTHLSSQEVSHYALSAVHIQYRGQSHLDVEFRVDDIPQLFPYHRTVFVFNWMSNSKRQNFFVVFTTPEAAAEAQQQHKDQAWVVMPLDQPKALKLQNFLNDVSLPARRRDRYPPAGPASSGSSSSHPTPSPTMGHRTVNHQSDNRSLPPRPPQASLKRSADDAFEYPAEHQYPSKRRGTEASSIDIPLSVATARPQPPPGPRSDSCPPWALAEIQRLQTEVARLKDRHAEKSIEPEMRALAITSHQDRTAGESPGKSPIFGKSLQSRLSTAVFSAQRRDASVSTDGASLPDEDDSMLLELQKQLELERKRRQALQEELRKEKELSSISGMEQRAELESMSEKIRQGKLYRQQFESLQAESEQLSQLTSEGMQSLRAELDAERALRKDAETARDEAIAARSDIESRIPAVIQLFQELEGIAAKSAAEMSAVGS